MGKVSIKKETEMITNYTPSKDTEEHVGFIYMRSIIIDGVKFIYIGESSNMLDRNYHWRCLKVEYGGKRIEKARKYMILQIGCGMSWKELMLIVPMNLRRNLNRKRPNISSNTSLTRKIKALTVLVDYHSILTEMLLDR